MGFRYFLVRYSAEIVVERQVLAKNDDLSKSMAFINHVLWKAPCSSLARLRKPKNFNVAYLFIWIKKNFKPFSAR